MMYLRKIIKYLFIFLVQPLLGQSYHNLAIAEDYQVKEARKEDSVLKEKYTETFYYIYAYHSSKENVKVYTASSADENHHFEWTSYVLKQTEKNKLSLEIVESDQESRKLNISFLDVNQSVSIDTSTFFLNQSYYAYLKKELLNNKNISELIDLIDEFLQEDIFKLEHLKFFSSKNKYRNKDFRILNAKMTTINSQNDNISCDWSIAYSYKNGILFSVEQKTKDETRYTKKLINNRNGLLSYGLYRQIDERFSDDQKITFDTKQNTYSEIGTYTQTASNKETDYKKTIRKSINSSLMKMELDKDEIIQIIQKLK